MKRHTASQKEAVERWMQALQAGAQANRDRINQNLEAGRDWSDERKAAWAEKAKKSWTPAMRQKAAERAKARHAARKAVVEQ